MKFETNSKVFFIENNRCVREAKVIKQSGDFYTIQLDTGGGIKLRANRLYATK